MGQLLWYRRGQRALTVASWNGLPRKTGVSSAMKIDPLKNHVRGNKNPEEHVRSVFAEAIWGLGHADAVIDVIGMGDGAEEVVKYLDRNWDRWGGQVRAICVGLGWIWHVANDVQNERFMELWGRVYSFPSHSHTHSFANISRQRGRAYLIHNEPVETPLHGRSEVGCNCFSSGEATFTECIMPRAYKSMLAYFKMVNDFPGYFEVENLVPEEKEEEDLVAASWGDVVRAESPRAA